MSDTSPQDTLIPGRGVATITIISAVALALTAAFGPLGQGASS